MAGFPGFEVIIRELIALFKELATGRLRRYLFRDPFLFPGLFLFAIFLIAAPVIKFFP